MNLSLEGSTRPVGPACVVVAHSDGRFVARAEEELGRRGWEVYPAGSGTQARRLAGRLRPRLVVLEAELPGESGWLTCAKLTRQHPRLDVVLVADAVGSWEESFGEFVGAARVVERRRGPTAVVPPGADAGTGVFPGRPESRRDE